MNATMYLARVFINGRKFVHVVDAYEHTVPTSGDNSHCKQIQRRARSWRMNSFGNVGAAAIALKPAIAIANAKLMLEIDKMDREDKLLRGKQVERIRQ